MFNKKINEVTERFFLSTLLPIIAFDEEGNVLACSGYEGRFDELFSENNVYERITEAFQKRKNNEPFMISNECNVNYTACYIDPKNEYKGIFILGPHTDIENNLLSIPYKPKCLMRNLISLLYLIEKDIVTGRCSKTNYSYHIKKALDYIDSKSTSDITLDDVADYININKSYFCTLLKKETGKTFTTLLNEIRIEKSKNLLSKNDVSILEVALASGFNNQNYFNIMFKKITGMTPLEYRKNN